MIKKLSILTLLISLLITSISSAQTSLTKGIGLIYGGLEVKWDENKDGTIINKNGEIFVPLYAVSKTIGANVYEDTKTKNITISKWHYSVDFAIGKKEIVVKTDLVEDFDLLVYLDQYAIDYWPSKNINLGINPGDVKQSLKSSAFIKDKITYVPASLFEGLGMMAYFNNNENINYAHSSGEQNMFFRENYVEFKDPLKSRADQMEYDKKYPIVDFVNHLKFDKIIEKYVSNDTLRDVTSRWVLLNEENYNQLAFTSLAIFNKSGSKDATIEIEVRRPSREGVLEIIEETVNLMAVSKNDASEIMSSYKKALKENEEFRRNPKTKDTIVNDNYAPRYKYKAKDGTKYEVIIFNNYIEIIIDYDRWRFIPKDYEKINPDLLFKDDDLFKYLSDGKNITIKQEENRFLLYDENRKHILTISQDKKKRLAIDTYSLNTKEQVQLFSKVLKYYSYSVEEANIILNAYLNSYNHRRSPLYKHEQAKLKTKVDFQNNGADLVWNTSILFDKDGAKSIKKSSQSEVEDEALYIKRFLISKAENEALAQVSSPSVDFTKSQRIATSMKKLETNYGYRKIPITPSQIIIDKQGGYPYIIYKSKAGLVISINANWTNENSLNELITLVSGFVKSDSSASEIVNTYSEYKNHVLMLQERSTMKLNPDGYLTKDGVEYVFIDHSFSKKPYVHIIIKNYK